VLKLGHRSFNREAEPLDTNARKAFHNLPPSSNIERCALNGVNAGGNPAGGSHVPATLPLDRRIVVISTLLIIAF